MTDTYEARGPHLPDVMTRQSPWVYFFVGAALVHALLGLRELSGRGLPIDVDAVLQVKVRIDETLVALVGAALFIRHPDARRAMPLVALGVGLLMLGTLLHLVRGPVESLLDGLAPIDDATIIPTPGMIAYRVFSSLVEIAAVVYLAAGLSASRERAPRSGERMAIVWLAAIGIVSVLLPYVVVGIFRQLTQGDLIVLGINIAIPVLSALVWAYLIAMTLGGWLNHEQPRPAWGLISAGGLLLLAIQVVNSLLITIANVQITVADTFDPGPSLGLFTLIGAASTIVWILFLVAFAMGLPARPERAEAPPESTAATDA